LGGTTLLNARSKASPFSSAPSSLAFSTNLSDWLFPPFFRVFGFLIFAIINE
jgi:hypothetical protein